MMPELAICVFCGSRHGDSPAYSDLATRTGAELVARGGRLVYGGGAVGLMGVVSDAALEAGGHVTGIIPDFLRHVEAQNERMSRSIITSSMLDRKQAMFDLSDGFLALPGGLGTLDEIIEVLTWRQLGQLQKPLVLLAEDGFWQPFQAVIEQAVTHSFADPDVHQLYTLATSVDEAMALLGLKAHESAMA